jgi:xanthine dehydrogenase YagT iron-sulfur-binding subunit
LQIGRLKTSTLRGQQIQQIQPFTTNSTLYMAKKQTSTRRDFFKQTAVLTAVAVTPNAVVKAAEERVFDKAAYAFEQVPIQVTINGKQHKIMVEPRVTLLDLLREQMSLTGTKKGCDHGQCGACTVHVDGRRVNSCLCLAVMQDGKSITTIEGLAEGENLHPMQTAFIEHDGFQCGYCTPGQIMSAVACVNEGHNRSETEIREFMSGNLCRCGAYPNIVKAIQSVS